MRPWERARFARRRQLRSGLALLLGRFFFDVFDHRDRSSAKLPRNYRSIGHFLNLAVLQHTRAIRVALPTTRLRNYSTQRLEDSQCAGLRSRSTRRTIEGHFHKVKIGEEVEGVIWKRALPTELVIDACDTANH